MNQYINTNPAFGMSGPFTAESKEDLADGMMAVFAIWAKERDDSEDMGIIIRSIREEFIDGLEEVKKTYSRKMSLEITEINIQPCSEEETQKSQCLAMVRIVLNDELVINTIRIIKGKFGLFIVFPREYDNTKKTGINICFPVTKRLHDEFAFKILKAYHVSQN